jgi:hypothetical protein
MAPRTKKSTPALEDFPKPLRMAIARVMAKFDMDYPEALERAAQLLDINSKIFEEEVEREAERRYKRRFMTQLNKARGTIEKNCERRVNAAFQDGFDGGFDEAKKEYGVWYNCIVCSQPIYIAPNSEAHRRVNAFLRSQRWGHSSCHEKRAGGS